MFINANSSFNNQFGANGKSMRDSLEFNQAAMESETVLSSTSFLTLSSQAAGELLSASRQALGTVLLSALLKK